MFRILKITNNRLSPIQNSIEFECSDNGLILTAEYIFSHGSQIIQAKKCKINDVNSFQLIDFENKKNMFINEEDLDKVTAPLMSSIWKSSLDQLGCREPSYRLKVVNINPMRKIEPTISYLVYCLDKRYHRATSLKMFESFIQKNTIHHVHNS